MLCRDFVPEVEAAANGEGGGGGTTEAEFVEFSSWNDDDDGWDTDESKKREMTHTVI